MTDKLSMTEIRVADLYKIDTTKISISHVRKNIKIISNKRINKAIFDFHNSTNAISRYTRI